jgi:ligand-binding sensor domain-containing protein
VKRGSRAKAVIAIAVVLVCASVLWIAWRAERALRGSERATTSEKDLGIHVSAIQEQPNPGFEAFSAPAVYHAAAFFEGTLYLSGPAGLYAYSLAGALERVYRVGLDLPPAPLGAMASGTLADSRHPELLIATAGEGVLAFDGSRFRQIRPEAAEARNVTAILPLGSGGLLMGTAKRGVLEFDGRSLKQFHPTTANLYVTALAGTESDVWIGTPNQGVLHWRGGAVESVGSSEGMPDVRVESLAVDGEAVYAGTPNGVAEIHAGKVARVLARGHFARAVQPDGKSLLVGEFDAGITAVPLNGEREPLLRRPIVSPADNDSDESATGVMHDPVEQFLAAGGSRYALTASALLERTPGGEWRAVLQGEEHRMTDGNVSALMVAGDGRLWVGYFDRGLDIFPAAGGRPVHVENDDVFCVNRIVENAKQGTVAVATANGLVLFDRDGHEKQVLTRDSGLIATHVTDVALNGGGMVAATPAGITFLDAGGPHSMYAFQGLVNNHVYALAAKQDALLVGTLGGLSVVSGGVVRRNLTTGNSGLKANWITALTPVDNDWLIGTYGAGIVRMDAEGKISPTEAAQPGTVVNPGAMIATGSEVLAGTLGKGLLVGDLTGTRWKTITAGLPSLNVTALAVRGGVVYLGTDNGLLKIAADRL